MASFYHAVTQNTKTSYKNVYYALIFALDTYFADLLFEGDHSRIITSSTDYALQKRAGTNEWNNANLPFLNYKLTAKDNGGSRAWFNSEAYTQGIYSSDIGVKVRLFPVTFSIDCTYWSSRDDDWQYATDVIIKQNAAETRMSFSLDYNGIPFENIAIINFHLDTSPKYTENDWLEKNHIHTFSLDPTAETFLVETNVDGFCVPEEAVINFLIKHKILGSTDTTIEYEQAIKLAIDQVNGTIEQE